MLLKHGRSDPARERRAARLVADARRVPCALAGESRCLIVRCLECVIPLTCLASLSFCSARRLAAAACRRAMRRGAASVLYRAGRPRGTRARAGYDAVDAWG